MHLEFVDLRLFIAVVETGSITAGAQRAALSLAAASARIRALELQVGAVLLERGRRGVSLTPAGGVLLRHARQLQRQAEALQLELGGYGGGGQVTLRLAANTAALSAWLPERLADFLIAHPQLDLALTEQGSDEAADAVREERADIAVVAGHADLSGLQVLPFREDRLVLVMAAAHPLAGAATLQLSELAGMDTLGLAGDSALQRHLRVHMNRAGVQVRMRAKVQGIDVLCRMLAQGMGVAILPHAAVQRSCVRDQLATVPLDAAWAPRQLSIVLRCEPAPSTMLQALVDWLQHD
ncbi:LysR family transcriptional regulator [Xanthomonas arboricola]|nr:LysR substrate-binding domain-containing protein [Xanthomonas arboricola]PPT95807.1 LysR family transcriptional regulator [Xanthomonas arboricola pv. arracaciae]SOU03207.1 putative LysR family transcriptional regulator [Xanthomonas arboricola pv. fragariae]MBB4605587.1 DNA-binding transcriptional LysR family regulator [Xanthomonas arboricola]MCC8669485.1 LysR family transcriptional regulator [Xanthomonas arboricola]PPT26379.1 LysR family transcriptional regulator [Xanthomonas arboricola]